MGLLLDPAFGVFIGSGLALILGGELLHRIENVTLTLPYIGALEYWQLTFILAGIPGLVLMFFTGAIREPKRRGLALDSSGAAQEASFKEAFALIWRNKRLFLALYLGGSIIAATAYLSAWYPELFMRTWDWPRLWAARASGWPSIIGGTAVLLFCGWYLQNLTQKGIKDAALKVAFWGAILIAVTATINAADA